METTGGKWTEPGLLNGGYFSHGRWLSGGDVVEVEVSFCYTLQVGWDVRRAFALVADVPLSAGHFPGLQRLDDLGDGIYRWNMQPLEFGKFAHQVRYSARYVADAEADTVVWDTVGADGNTRADGSWRIKPLDGGAELTFQNRLAVQLPIPRLMARPARKVVPGIMDKQTRTYLTAIAQKMDGTLVA